MPFDAIIFDSDGTLVDSEHLLNEVLVERAAAFGIALTLEEAIARFRGARMADSIAYLEGLAGKSLPKSFESDLRKRLAEVLTSRLHPVDGALELVRSLRVPFCVASNAPRAKVELCLKVTGLQPYFEDRIFSSYEVGLFKPDPGLFLHAARSLGVSPGRCAVVEDSAPGIHAGLAAGMAVFALEHGLSRAPLPPQVQVVSGLRELIPRFAL